MQEPKDVCVFAEVQDGAVAEVSLELVNKARELAGELGGAVGAFLVGSGLDALVEELFAHGCAEVHVGGNKRNACGRWPTTPRCPTPTCWSA